ncbi:MAG: hypothetical protein ACC656_15250, partial [Candidatus Heimdallarchaeota archaeon]
DGVIVEYFNGVPIVEIDSGYTARWTGTDTQTLFFKFNQSASTSVSLLDLTSKVFYNDSVGAPDVLLGRIEMDYFTPNTDPFGGEFPATVVQWKGNATYVSITVTPPNENDQFVKAAKDELGLSPGFDVEYAFWGERFDVDDFVPDEDFILEDSSNPSANAYYWNLADDTLVGLNSTGAALATIIDLDEQDMPINSLDSTLNDILNVLGHQPTILPAGNYLLLFTGAPLPTEARIHTIPLLSLNLGDQGNFALNLDESLFFQLPVNLPVKEYFNFTYLDELNATIDVDFKLYDSTFTQQTAFSFLFEEYYSNPTTLVSNNNTVFGNANEAQQYNIELGYLRVT